MITFIEFREIQGYPTRNIFLWDEKGDLKQVICFYNQSNSYKALKSYMKKYSLTWEQVRFITTC